tara:strand:+ start:8014 stop:9291 length:1278 start_codon:yes stop_codon:yes gene_type:complete
LILIYGTKYIYRFLPFYIIGDKSCGYKFRKNLNSSKINFPIYERHAFPGNIKIPIDIKENISKRVKFNTDENSLRITPFNSNFSKTKLKIICSGGSTTAGIGINDEDTWPNKLKEKLNENGYECEVLNAGVYGYDSFQELQNIKNNLIKLKPDVIILHQGWNEEFEFSALGAGKYFKPNHARGYFEKMYFFTNNIPFLPTKLITFLLLYRFLRRRFSLIGNKSFQKEKRWSVLLNDKYIKNWFDNIYEISKICKKNKIHLFLADYPCLVNTYDSKEDRNTYIQNSRLTNNFAAYQSFAKERIEEFYFKLSNYFDIIDGKILFKDFKGKERLNLFSDEIHLSEKGEKLFSESIFKSLENKLIKDRNLLLIKESKKILTESDYRKLRKLVGINSRELNIDIRRHIIKNLSISDDDKLTVSTDVYTTS